MDLRKIKNSAYDAYEELLLARDQIRKEAGQIWTVYQKHFGKLHTEIFRVKLACIRCKKTIAYYQTAINRGQPVDQDAMQTWLEQELSEYKKELDRMLNDYDRAARSAVCTEYEAQRSKQLYRRIAKLIHPDINPETDRHDELRELWIRAQAAYGQNDVKELAEVEVLVRKVLEEIGLGTERVEIPDLETRIAELKEEIEEIKAAKPYIYKQLVEDEEAVEKERCKLQEELETYRVYQKELETRIEEIIDSGEVSIKWRMN